MNLPPEVWERIKQFLSTNKPGRIVLYVEPGQRVGEIVDWEIVERRKRDVDGPASDVVR